MPERRVSRRQAITGAGALGASALAAPAFATSGATALNLSSPEALSEARIKIVGSIAEETVTTFQRFHIYGDPHGGNLTPLFSMNNLHVDKWRPVERGTYALTHFEVGYYTEFDSETPLENWKNPYTEEMNEIFVFRLGPVLREYYPDRIVAPGLAPDPLTLQVIGDRVFLPTLSTHEIPNMFSPEEFPEESTGEIVYWDSMFTYSAPLAAVADPAVANAPNHCHLQNAVSWAPWMRMGLRPGRTTVQAFGCKIAGFEALPAKTRAGFEKYTPEIFETATWTDPIFESLDYYEYLESQRAG